VASLQFGRAGHAVAGVVDQAIQASQPGGRGVLVDGGGRGGDVAGLGDIEDERGDLPALPRGGPDEPVAIGRLADARVDVLAGRGEPECRGTADSGRGAGDEGVFSCAVHDSSVSGAAACGPAGEPMTW
jgi:hypothetical protein